MILLEDLHAGEPCLFVQVQRLLWGIPGSGWRAYMHLCSDHSTIRQSLVAIFRSLNLLSNIESGTGPAADSAATLRPDRLAIQFPCALDDPLGGWPTPQEHKRHN